MTRNSEQKLYKSRQWLKRMYVVEGHSSVKIAEMCSVSHQTIRDWLKKFGVKIRQRGWGAGIQEKAQVRLSIDLYNGLKRLSKKTGVSMTKIQEVAIFEYMMKRGVNPFKES